MEALLSQRWLLREVGRFIKSLRRWNAHVFPRVS
jgi:hypothetical protein